MPIYEYKCGKCHHHLEALQKISDKPLRECPECGRHTLTRLVSAPMFRLAGSGWYETDFKSDKETKRNLAGRDEAPAESAKESGDQATPKTDKTDRPTRPTRPEDREDRQGRQARRAGQACRETSGASDGCQQVGVEESGAQALIR